jgi:hypothetical protein
MKRFKDFIIGFCILIILICIIAIGVSHLHKNNPDSKILAEISALTDKVNKLEVEQSKTVQNVNKSIAFGHEDIYKMQCEVKIQNEFIQMQYDSFNAYYNKRLKELLR